MTTYTREHLEQKISMKVWECDLAAFTLALLDENEALRRDKIQLGEERAAEWKRAEKAEAERDDANDERDDAVARWSRRAREAEAACKELLQVQAERDRLREELREAEKRMKAWGCPDYDYICLNCGRETPCITEADLRPGDPGVPCTFDLTYPQMIERLRHYEDRQRKAEAERDEARAMKVPATTEAVTLAEMGEKVARTEAWAAKEELRIAEAERDRLQRALDLSEQAHHEIREVCERHGVENALGLSVRLESVCDERDRLRDDLSKCGEEKSIQESIHDLLTERDRLRAQLDSILANSDSLESGKLADAHAENKRLREELAEAEEAIRLLAWERCEDCGGTGVVWAGPMDDPQQAQCERCWSEGLVPPPPDPFPIGQRMAHPAVRRARERAGRG